jgi:hypothetical protein
MNNITWITENLSDHSSIMDGYIKGRLSFGINDYSDVFGRTALIVIQSAALSVGIEEKDFGSYLVVKL